MYKRLKFFFEINALFLESQYGFREEHSTQHGLIDIVNRIQNNMDKGVFSTGVFIDLKKAFDKVDHDILLIFLIFFLNFFLIFLNFFKFF